MGEIKTPIFLFIDLIFFKNRYRPSFGEQDDGSPIDDMDWTLFFKPWIWQREKGKKRKQ